MIANLLANTTIDSILGLNSKVLIGSTKRQVQTGTQCSYQRKAKCIQLANGAALADDFCPWGTDTYSLNIYVLLDFKHKNGVTTIVKLVWSYESQASGSVKFDNDCNVIFMFKICLLRRRYLAFNFIDFDSLRSAYQIFKSRQKIRGSGLNKYNKNIL